MYLAYNQNIIDSQSALISLQSEAVLYGYGAFETVKIKDGFPCFFDAHIERLKKACQTLSLSFDVSTDSLRETVMRLIEKNNSKEGVLRVSLFKEGNTTHNLLTIAPPRYTEADYKNGFKLCYATHPLKSEGPLVGTKHNNYLENLLSLKQAKERGYNEAMFLNEKSHLAEGCVSNLFFVKDNRLFTPAVSTGLLPGIMRAQVIQTANTLNIPVSEDHFQRDALEDADEVFVTNSLVEIMPVVAIEKVSFDIKNAPITRALHKHLS